MRTRQLFAFTSPFDSASYLLSENCPLGYMKMHLIKVYVGFLSLSTVLALPLAAQRSSTSALSAREEKVALMARAAPLYEDTPHPRELQRDGSGKAVESFQKPQLPSEEGSSPNGNGASRRIKGSIYDDSEMPDITQRGSWDIEARAKKYSKPVPGGKVSAKHVDRSLTDAFQTCVGRLIDLLTYCTLPRIPSPTSSIKEPVSRMGSSPGQR